MRKRTRGEPPALVTGNDVWVFQTTSMSQPTTTLSSYTYTGSCDYEEMNDFVTPNFRKRIAAGELIISPMSYSQYRRTVGSGHSCKYVTNPGNIKTWTRDGTANWTQVVCDLGRAPVYTKPVTSTLSDANLALEALSRVDPTAYSLMEDVLEIKSNLHSLISPLSGINDIVKKFPRQPGRGTTSAWLKYRFEILPLYGTVSSLIGACTKPWKRLEAGVRLRASSTSSDNQHVTGNFWDSPHNNLFTVHHSKSVYRRCVVFYKLRTPSAGLAQTLGTRCKDLPVGVWNTVSLSFMVDRFFDVSTYLKAVANMADPNVSVEGSCIVDRSNEIISKQLFQQHYDSTYTVASGPVVDEYKNVNRYSAPSPLALLNPFVSLDFRPKELISTATKAADLAALVFQRLAK